MMIVGRDVEVQSFWHRPAHVWGKLLFSFLIMMMLIAGRDVVVQSCWHRPLLMFSWASHGKDWLILQVDSAARKSSLKSISFLQVYGR